MFSGLTCTTETVHSTLMHINNSQAPKFVCFSRKLTNFLEDLLGQFRRCQYFQRARTCACSSGQRRAVVRHLSSQDTHGLDFRTLPDERGNIFTAWILIPQTERNCSWSRILGLCCYGSETYVTNTTNARQKKKSNVIVGRTRNVSSHNFFTVTVAGDRRSGGALTKFLMSDVERPAPSRRMEFSLPQKRIRNSCLSSKK